MISRDLLWKGVITSLADDFLAFFFPDVFPLLDLSKGIEFLDKELEQLFPESVERYFGQEDSLGRGLLLDGNISLTVTGVLANALISLLIGMLFFHFSQPILFQVFATHANPRFS